MLQHYNTERTKTLKTQVKRLYLNMAYLFLIILPQHFKYRLSQLCLKSGPPQSTCYTCALGPSYTQAHPAISPLASRRKSDLGLHMCRLTTLASQVSGPHLLLPCYRVSNPSIFLKPHSLDLKAASGMMTTAIQKCV